MAWAFIDSTAAGRFRIGTLDGARPRVRAVDARSNRLLPEIKRRLPLDVLRGIEGICVVQGPGSFTSVRTGVLVANLLARFLRKPLVGVTTAEAEDLEALGAALESRSLCAVEYAAPLYDAEPNITVKVR